MKKINNLKLLVFLGFVVSCTPNLNSTSPSTKPTITSTSTPMITPSPVVSETASIPITDTTPIPTSLSSPNPDYKNLKVKEIRIYNGNTIIARKNFETKQANEITYNILPGESIKFIAEIIYENGLINKNVIWKSENSSYVSVDNTGLIKAESQFGKSYISLSDNNNSSLNFGITVNYLPALSKTYKLYKDCEYRNVTYNIPRFESYTTVNGFSYYPDTGITVGMERATLHGKVYASNGNPVEGATVNAVSTEPGVNWTGEAQVTVGGAYVFRNVPLCTKIAITVTKDGWATRTRQAVLKSDLQSNPSVNMYNFDGIYAIQDEPEITQLKVNGKVINKSSKDDEFLIDFNKPKNSKPTPEQLNTVQLIQLGNLPELTGVNSNTMEIEMTFSEPIKVYDVRNFFRLRSQSGIDNKPESFTVDANYPGTEWIISDDERVVTFKTNKAVLANRGGDESRYLIDFSQAFRDKTDKSAIDRKYFKFSPSQMNDFAVFSVKNDEESPKLLSIAARDSGSVLANDTIELRYSEPMELIKQASYPAVLADPNSPSDVNRKLWYKDTNNIKASANSLSNSTEDNNATLVGFSNDGTSSGFKASYMIGRVLAKDVINGTPKMSILGTIGRDTNTTAKRDLNLLRDARIIGNNVLLEFSPTAFDRDDRVVVSVSKSIQGSYIDINRTPIVNEDLTVNVSSNIDYSFIYDPAGRLIDNGTPAKSANIDVNNSQRVATAS